MKIPPCFFPSAFQWSAKQNIFCDFNGMTQNKTESKFWNFFIKISVLVVLFFANILKRSYILSNMQNVYFLPYSCSVFKS